MKKTAKTRAARLLEEARMDPSFGTEAGSDKAVLWLAEELRDLGVRPEDVLARALMGERIARGVKPFDPLKALRVSPEALFSPRVLDALFGASALSLRPPRVTAWIRTSAGRALPARVATNRPPEAHLVRMAARILTTPKADWNTIAEGLRLAWFVTWEAERVARDHPECSQPVALALRALAKREGRTIGAIRKAIERGKGLAPNLDWPERRARRG